MTMITIDSINGGRFSVPVVNIAFVTLPNTLKRDRERGDYGGVTLLSGEYIQFTHEAHAAEIVKVLELAGEGDLLCS